MFTTYVYQEKHGTFFKLNCYVQVCPWLVRLAGTPSLVPRTTQKLYANGQLPSGIILGELLASRLPIWSVWRVCCKTACRMPPNTARGRSVGRRRILDVHTSARCHSFSGREHTPRYGRMTHRQNWHPKIPLEEWLIRPKWSDNTITWSDHKPEILKW